MSTHERLNDPQHICERRIDNLDTVAGFNKETIASMNAVDSFMAARDEILRMSRRPRAVSARVSEFTTPIIFVQSSGRSFQAKRPKSCWIATKPNGFRSLT